ADLDHSLYIQTTGQSGNPLSPFYRSFATRWSKGEYIEIPTQRQAVDAASLGTWTLTPKEGAAPRPPCAVDGTGACPRIRVLGPPTDGTGQSTADDGLRRISPRSLG